jgi:rubrerythrin
VSIIESLKRLVDPVQVRQEEAERKAAREQPKREPDGDPPQFACRVCGHVGTDQSYCPQCLADTMEPVQKKDKAP